MRIEIQPSRASSHAAVAYVTLHDKDGREYERYWIDRVLSGHGFVVAPDPRKSFPDIYADTAAECIGALVEHLTTGAYED